MFRNPDPRTMSKIIRTLTNETYGTSTIVAEATDCRGIRTGYAVLVRDDDAGEFIGLSIRYPEKMPDGRCGLAVAMAKADAIHAGRP